MLLLKATLIWSMTLAGAALLRKAHASDRHRFWTIGFGALLLLPVLTALLPSLDVPVPAWPRAAAGDIAHLDAAARGVPRYPLSAAYPAPSETARIDDAPPPAAGASELASSIAWPLIRAVLVALWVGGSAAAVAMILLSLARVSRLRRTGDELDDAVWRTTAASLAEQLGISRPVRLIVHHRVTTPMAGGLWRPAIFLPDSATSWSSEQRAIVLAHELAHLSGRDPVRLLAARLAVAFYWFHPLAWLAARQSTIAREQACDAAVLAIGTRPSAYARVLLAFAESMTSRPAALAALPIVDPSLLEIRLMAILRDERRQAARSRVLLPFTLAAVATMTIAAARPLALAVASPIAPLSPAPSIAPAAATPAPPAAPVPVVQRSSTDFACWTGGVYGSSFNGTITTSPSGVSRQIGRSGGDRVIQERVGDTRVCMLAQNVGDSTVDERPSAWIGHADRILMETRHGDAIQRLTLDGRSTERVSWSVNGSVRPFDAAAEQWRDRLLAYLDLTWQISSLQGHVSSLRGEISSIRGEESSLRGEISSLRGEVSSMRGRQSSIRGDESSLRGEISSIRGHVSSLHGEISSEEGEISSLNATRYDADAGERGRIDASIARHQDAITRIERELGDYNEDAKIAAVEAQIRALDADAKVSAIDDEIRKFDVDGKVAKIEQQIKALDVDGKIATIEKQIAGLDADRKVRDLESRRDKARSDLEAAVARIR